MPDFKNHKHILILLFALTAIALLFACTPEENADNNKDIPATSISLNMDSLEMEIGGTETLIATVEPSTTTDKIEWSSSSQEVATVTDGEVTAVAPGTAIITAKAGSNTAKCEVIVKEPVLERAVDLGLSVYWAKCNIGADSPEQYGDYYAWGETETKDNYSWETYKWCNNGDYDNLTKYGTVDNKTVLDLEDDVAHLKLGGKWRMPTDEEFTELRTNCTWTWTTENDVNGYKVTAPNGNSIFLPAAGGWNESSLYLEGSLGYYWSSSLNSDSPSIAWRIFFSSGTVHRGDYVRYYGFSVRPVTE